MSVSLLEQMMANIWFILSPRKRKDFSRALSKFVYLT